MLSTPKNWSFPHSEDGSVVYQSHKVVISGNVVKSRFRRPNVSIVFTAGSANKKLTAPNPKLARNAYVLLKPACKNRFVE